MHVKINEHELILDKFVKIRVWSKSGYVMIVVISVVYYGKCWHTCNDFVANILAL